MFMVKDEYTNVRNLLKVKMKTTAKNFKWFFIVAAIMFLGSLVSAIFSIFQGSGLGLTWHTISDYSGTFFFAIVIIYLVFMLTYRQTNDYLSVFPQTNTSRFIASQLWNYTFAVTIGLTALVMYLLHYSVLKLISLFKEEVYFALNFDIGFVITGFLTFIIYSFLVIAAYELIGVVLRKWRIYAILVMASLLSFMIMNLGWIIENPPKIFMFIIREPVPAWLMLKGIALWLIITAVSLVINRSTVYYKSQKKTTSAGIVTIWLIVAIIVMVIPAVLIFNTSAGGGAVRLWSSGTAQDYRDEFTKIYIDVSHLPKGSKLNVEGEKVSFPAPDGSHETRAGELVAFGAESWDSLQGDNLIIEYRLPRYQVNGFELYGYINPKLTAYLVDDTLHIDYTFENAHVIIMPVWSIARQFDCYKDKGLLPEVPWGYSSGGSGSGNINIRVE